MLVIRVEAARLGIVYCLARVPAVLLADHEAATGALLALPPWWMLREC